MASFPWWPLLPTLPSHSTLCVTLLHTISIYTCIFYLKCHPHALTLSLNLSFSLSLRHLPLPHSTLLRPLQPGSIGRWHVWPEAAWSAASRSNPDPEAAGGGGRLRRVKHRTQRPQLLPACMFAHKHTQACRYGLTTHVCVLMHTSKTSTNK